MTRRVSNILRRFIVPMIVYSLIAFSESALGQNMPDPAHCDPQLGRDYDKRTPAEKSVRLKLYAKCRYGQDFNVLQMKYYQAKHGVQDWSNRSFRIVQVAINAKWQAARAELSAQHNKERTKLTSEQSSKYAALNASQTSQNYYEINRQRNELTTKFRADNTGIFKRQSAESALLQSTFARCEIKSSDTLKRMVATEHMSLDTQFGQKSKRLTSEYATLQSTPGQMSIADYESRQQNPAAQPKSAKKAVSAVPLMDGSSENGPVGAIQDSKGNVTVTRPTGETAQGTIGTPIYQGDVVETGTEGECNIVFADETSFTVSKNAKLVIDEYVYDPSSGDDKKEFSWLRGLFIFTSGLIGRQNEVQDVAVGGFGIRG